MRTFWQSPGHRTHIRGPPHLQPQEGRTSPTSAEATQAVGPQGKAKENLKHNQGFQQAPLHPPPKALPSVRTSLLLVFHSKCNAANYPASLWGSLGVYIPLSFCPCSPFPPVALGMVNTPCIQGAPTLPRLANLKQKRGSSPFSLSPLFCPLEL